MKKKIPSVIKINIEYNQLVFEAHHIKTINEDYDNGYRISENDKQLYYAILIKDSGVETLTEKEKEYCIPEGELLDNIRFQIIRSNKVLKKHISVDDYSFYFNFLKQKVAKRKLIVHKEINRTGINANKISFQNSEYLRTLLSFISKLDDEITLIRWFIPIKLSFEKGVHIFIKHVEETKFADGNFKKRTYFKYEFEEIFTLLKIILKQEEEKIKDHFIEIAVAETLNEQEKIKEYIDNWINYNGDTFSLSIDSKGYITKFHPKT